MKRLAKQIEQKDKVNDQLKKKNDELNKQVAALAKEVARLNQITARMEPTAVCLLAKPQFKRKNTSPIVVPNQRKRRVVN